MKIWHYGDDVNTDMLFPGRYIYTTSTTEDILQHLFEDLDPMFAKNAKAGDYVLAGNNFGCGSSREQPALGLKALGIQAVIAKSFARIFYRSAINQGLILIECAAAVNAYKKGDLIECDVDKGIIKIAQNLYSFPPLPPEILAIRDAGGLLSYVRNKLSSKNNRVTHG